MIVAKLDRLTRSVRDLAELIDLFNQKRVCLVSVAETLETGSAAGRMMMNVLASVAQWEREIISERTGEVLRAKRKRGELAGNVPYGYVASDGKLVENPAERAVLARMRELRASGMSLRDVAETLNAEGRWNRRGTAWRFQYVANVLRGASNEQD